MKSLFAFIFLGILSCSIPFSAFAEEEDMGPCHADVQTYCKDVKPGKGRILKCMKENESKLSTACKEHQAHMKDMMKKSRDACHEDMEKHCGSIKAGGGAKLKCMHDHKDVFSKECQESIDKMKAEKKAK